MNVLVTGAAGFLGSHLAQALLAGAERLPRVSRLIAADITPAALADPRVEVETGSVADESFVRAIVPRDTDMVFHLAAVLSGQSEAEFELGFLVNLAGTRNLLEACRRLAKPPRFVFTSTVAVFGGPLPDTVPERLAPTPQSSYGTAKAMAELLVSEYSRRGFIDGISCRLPTVAIRPGKPNSALSSFVSGIVREPLAGIEALCPVPLEMRQWITSPGVLTQNLLHAARLDTSALNGVRMVNLPGLTVTVGEMLDSLERLAGPKVRALVRCEPDERVLRIVRTWPTGFDISGALRLGFAVDRHIDDVIRQYMETTGRGAA